MRLRHGLGSKSGTQVRSAGTLRIRHTPRLTQPEAAAPARLAGHSETAPGTWR
jgi:hypothetical protein